MVNTETKKDQQLYEKPCKQCGHCCTVELDLVVEAEYEPVA